MVDTSTSPPNSSGHPGGRDAILMSPLFFSSYPGGYLQSPSLKAGTSWTMAWKPGRMTHCSHTGDDIPRTSAHPEDILSFLNSAHLFWIYTRVPEPYVIRSYDCHLCSHPRSDPLVQGLNLLVKSLKSIVVLRKNRFFEPHWRNNRENLLRSAS